MEVVGGEVVGERDRPLELAFDALAPIALDERIEVPCGALKLGVGE